MNLKYAILSGFLASLGSVLGKLSSEWDHEYQVNLHFSNRSADFVLSKKSISFQGTVKVLVASFFQILMVLCNIAGLTVFTKSLAEIDSTVVATVTNTACNFIFSVSSR